MASAALPLPYSSGSKIVTQGFNTGGSHDGALKWAVDFGLSYGEMAHAVIGGEIVAYRQNVAPSYMLAGQMQAGSAHGNYVTIKSNVDGQDVFATFAHLAENFLANTMQISAGEGAQGSYGFVAMGDDLGRVGASGNRVTSQGEQRLNLDPVNPESGNLVDFRGAHLHVHLGTEIVYHGTAKEWIANGAQDQTLPVHYAAFGVDESGTPINPVTPVSYAGTDYQDFVDPNYDDFSADTATTGRMVIGVTEKDQVWGTLQERPAGQPDSDWVAVDLAQGVTYAFAMRGVDTASHTQGLPTLANPTLRIRDADGNQITWDGAPWATGMQTAEDGAGGRDARVIFTAPETGTYYLVGYSSTEDVGSYRLSGVRSSPWPDQNTELALGDKFRVDLPKKYGQIGPETTTLNNGDFVVTWNSGAINARIFHADGSVAGDEFVVNTLPSGSQNRPTISALDNGGFAVTWADFSHYWDESDGWDIHGQVFDAAGTKVGSEFLVNTTTEGLQSAPAISHLENGRFVITWGGPSWADSTGNYRAINAQIFTATGEKEGGEFQVNSTTHLYHTNPVVTTLDDGRFIVAWEGYSQTGADTVGYGIRAQMFSGDGTRDGSEFLVNATTFGDQSESSIATLNDGRFIIVWQDSSKAGDGVTGDDIRAQIFDPDGTTSGAEFVVNSGTDGYQRRPAIAALENGQFVVTWQDYSESVSLHQGWAVRAQVFDADGSKAGSEFLIDPTTSDERKAPSITALDDGRFTMAWTDLAPAEFTNPTPFISAQIFDTNGDSGQTAADAPLPLVSTITGSNVTVSRRGSDGVIAQSELNDGAVINSGDRINTGADGTVKFVLATGAVTTLRPNSVVDINSANNDTQIRVFEGDLDYAHEDTNPDRGNIWNRVIKPLFTRDFFEIESGDISIGVRGTAFSYSYRIDGDGGTGNLAIDLQSGAVDVINKSEGTVTALETTGASYAAVIDAPTLPLPPINTTVTGSVTITGIARAGDTLSADTSTLEDPDGLGAFTYQWFESGEKIAEETASTFALTQAQVGKAISVKVRYVDGEGAVEGVVSAKTTAVTSSQPEQVILTASVTGAGGAPFEGATARFLPTGSDLALIAQDTESGQYNFDLVTGDTGRLSVSRAWDKAADPVIDASDALNALRIAVGLDPSWGAADGFDFIAADINRDGQVTAVDALEILRIAVGLETAAVPQWVGYASNVDLSTVNESNIQVTEGVDIADIESNTTIDITAVLLGNLDNFI